MVAQLHSEQPGKVELCIFSFFQTCEGNPYFAARMGELKISFALLVSHQVFVVIGQLQQPHDTPVFHSVEVFLIHTTATSAGFTLWNPPVVALRGDG